MGDLLTSPIEQVVVECPQCGRRYRDWFRASINADLDPELATDPEYVREASTATCPDCGHVVELAVLHVEGDVWRFRGPWNADA